MKPSPVPGAGRRLLSQGLRALVRQSGRVPILTYHRIHPDPSPISVSPQAFEQQLQVLKELFRPLSLTELVWCLERDKPVPAGAVVLTFDDGFRDNYTTALPLLKAYEVPATFFVATSMIGREEYYWFDRIQHGLKPTSAVAAAWPAIAPALEGKSRSEQIALVTEALKREESRTARALLEAVCDPIRPPGRQTMSWNEVRALASAGMEIGSHTVTHPILSRQAASEAAWEVAHSKQSLETELGFPILHFAYPNGQRRDYSPEVLAAIRQAGYRSACTMVPGLASARSSLFELERLSIRFQYQLPQFLMKLSGRFIRPSA